jgi:hypothetical protein
VENNAPQKQRFNSLIQMMNAVPGEQVAVDHFTAIRWKHGAFYSHCGSTKVYYFSDNRNHKRGDCHKRFSIKVGTILDDSKIGLREWMLAVWLITSHKKGIASTRLAKEIGVTQKTAWSMLHRLRYAAQTKSFNHPVDGMVVADETFIGGKKKHKHAWHRTARAQGGKGKTAVLGILKGEGELRNVQSALRNYVGKGAVTLTDEYRSFQGLAGDYMHHTVKGLALYSAISSNRESKMAWGQLCI